jgi:hypothetical protein
MSTDFHGGFHSVKNEVEWVGAPNNIISSLHVVSTFDLAPIQGRAVWPFASSQPETFDPKGLGFKPWEPTAQRDAP